jgi:hemolysin activation/secretion protein
VHGHQSGTYLGDDGYTVNLEARYTLFSTKKSKYQLLAFGDHGMIRTKKPVLGQKDSEKLSGTGLGFYADINGMFDVRVDYGVPVGTKTGDDSIVSFEVKYKF